MPGSGSQYIAQREALKKVLVAAKAGERAPVYLLWGDEPQFLRAAREQLIRLLVPEEQRATAITNFDGEDPDSYNEDRLREALQSATLGFFDTQSDLIVVKNPPTSARRTDAEAFVRAVKNALEAPDDRSLRSEIARARSTSPAFAKAFAAAVKEFHETGRQPELPSESLDAAQSEEVEVSDRELGDFAALAVKPELLQSFSPGDDSHENPLEVFCKAPVEGKTLLIVVEGQLAANNSLTKAVKQGSGVILGFTQLTDKEDLWEFIGSMLRRQGKLLADEAQVELQLRCGNNAAQLQQAVSLLSLYVGDRKAITADDVRQVVPESAEVTVFELTDALGERDTHKALGLLERMFDAELEPMMIFSLIVRQFRLLLQARLLLKEAGKKLPQGTPFPRFRSGLLPELKRYAEALPSDVKLNLLKQHDFVVYKTINQAQRFSLEQTALALLFLHTVDISLKTESAGVSGGRRRLEAAVIRLSRAEFDPKVIL